MLKSHIRFGVVLVVLLCMMGCYNSQDQEEFNIEDYPQQGQQRTSQEYLDTQNAQRQMQFLSQRRTACLVLSRYYTNQFSDDINGIIKDLQPQDQQKFINKLYATAIQKCQPLITQGEVMQFFTTTQANFDPTPMFHIFDGYNFHQVTLDIEQLTPQQQNIVKFMKQFDSEMEIKKQQQQAQEIQDQRDQGIEVFFISMKNLPPQLKYLYVVLVILISGAILYWAFNQIGKPQKKPNKRRKKQ